jgi:predicted dehydrogenase
MTPGVGIIGAGLIGAKRAAHLKGARLVAVTDLASDRAAALAKTYGAQTEPDWQHLIARADIQVVMVCTTHEALVPCALAALEAGKHVLIEKPAGRNPEEIDELRKAAAHAKGTIRVGFNHRFHPAFQKAKQLLAAGEAGPLMYIRARYGHGGRLRYEKEWRADVARSGGGELLDQGVHLIDLCRWLGGEFDLGWGRAKTFFWNMAADDNGFVYLESPDRKRSAFLHASCTEWKNLFDFEIFGRTAKLEIWGLGRSYGPEELRVYRMKPEMGPPAMETHPFPEEDRSWAAEFTDFLSATQGRASSMATLDDAWKAVSIVHGVYAQSGLLETRS